MNEHIQLMIDWIEDNLKKEFSLDKLSNYMGFPLSIVLLNYTK